MDTESLRNAPLFRGLDDEAAAALSASLKETRIRRGDVLFSEGDEGDQLYIVTEGKVKLGRSSVGRTREPAGDPGAGSDVR